MEVVSMSTMEVMKEVRNQVAQIFGENKVTELKFHLDQMRYHKEYDYSFVVNDKTTITLRSGYDRDYIGGFYEMHLTQIQGDKIKNVGKTRLNKNDITVNNLTELLHNKFKLPRN